MAKRNAFNQLAITLIMGAIIIAFVFTGVTSLTNSAGEVADVDGTPVTVGEYNRALNRTLDYYTQMNKGKSLTQKEIRTRGIRESVLEQLISGKIMLNFAMGMKFDAGKDAVKNAITTSYPDFQTNGKFDITKYKRILKMNNISFKKFEEDMVNIVINQKLDDVLQSQRYSTAYTKDLARLRNTKAKVNAISFVKEEMTKNLTVTQKEVDDFLAEGKSKAYLDSLYTQYKAKDPKKNTKTLAQMKFELSKQHLRTTKREDLKKFNETLTQDLTDAFNKNNWSKVKSLAKKYGLKFQNNAEISLLGMQLPNIKVDEEKMRAHFSAKNTTDAIIIDDPLTMAIVKANKYETTTPEQKEIDSFLNFSKSAMARSLNFEILEIQKKKAKVTRASNLFL